MNFNFIINKFFETKLVKGFPDCPDCPPEPCTEDCCDGNGSGDGPCPCCTGTGGPPGGGGGPGPFGGAPGGEVEVQEVEDFFMAVGVDPVPMSDFGNSCPDCDSCGAGGGGGGGIPVNIFPSFIPNPNPPPEPVLFPANRNEQQLQWCIGSWSY